VEIMRFPRVPHSRVSRVHSASTSVAGLADDEAGARRRHRGDGLSAAIALLTATGPMPGSSQQSQDEALSAVIPADCVGLIDLFAGLYAVAHILLLELSSASGEPLAAPLQRLAVSTLVGRGDA
jgi:hypothetical protein